MMNTNGFCVAPSKLLAKSRLAKECEADNQCGRAVLAGEGDGVTSSY